MNWKSAVQCEQLFNSASNIVNKTRWS